MPSDISIAGASSDQKLAAIMMPAANPSMASSSRLLTSRVRKTPAAPSAVTPQVKRVARRACVTGASALNSMLSPRFVMVDASKYTVGCGNGETV